MVSFLKMFSMYKTLAILTMFCFGLCAKCTYDGIRLDRTCAMSDWLPWNCSSCEGGPMDRQVVRYKVVCCEANMTLVACRHHCNRTISDDTQTGTCSKHCSLGSTIAYSRNVTGLSPIVISNMSEKNPSSSEFAHTTSATIKYSVRTLPTNTVPTHNLTSNITPLEWGNGKSITPMAKTISTLVRSETTPDSFGDGTKVRFETTVFNSLQNENHKSKNTGLSSTAIGAISGTVGAVCLFAGIVIVVFVLKGENGRSHPGSRISQLNMTAHLYKRGPTR